MEFVNGLYGSEFNKNKACGYCRRHGKYMTVKMLRKHNCLGKNCWHFDKNEEHSWWTQRALTKQKRIERKERLATVGGMN